MKRLPLPAALLVLFAFAGTMPPSHAQAPESSGNWLMFNEEGNLTAMTIKPRPGLLVSCEKGLPTVALVHNPKDQEALTQGEKLTVTFRADQGLEIITPGRARTARAIEMNAPPNMIRDLTQAQTVTFHIAPEKNPAFTREYGVEGAAIVLPKVLETCAPKT